MTKFIVPALSVVLISFFGFVLINQYQNNSKKDGSSNSTSKKDDTILGVESKLIESIKVSSSVSNLEQNPEAESYIQYMYIIENFGEHEVYNLKTQTNLTNTFKGNSYEVESVSSDFFNVNSKFNGSNDIDLITNNNSIQPGQTATILLNVKFYSDKAAGPYKNEIDVKGDIDGPQNDDNGKSEEEEDDDDDNDKENEGEVTGTKPPTWITDFTPEEDHTERTITLYLANHKNGQIITEIKEGDVFDYNDLPEEVRIIAGITPVFKGRVIFSVNNSHNFTDHFTTYEYKLPLQYVDYTVKVDAYADQTYNYKLGSKIVNFKIINLINTEPEDSEENEITEEDENGTENEQILYTTAGSASVIFDLIKRLTGGSITELGSVSASSSSSQNNTYFILGSTSFGSQLEESGINMSHMSTLGVVLLFSTLAINKSSKLIAKRIDE